MYIYIYIYIYICVCVCVCVRARVCVCVCDVHLLVWIISSVCLKCYEVSGNLFLTHSESKLIF